MAAKGFKVNVATIIRNRSGEPFHVDKDGKRMTFGTVALELLNGPQENVGNIRAAFDLGNKVYAANKLAENGTPNQAELALSIEEAALLKGMVNQIILPEVHCQFLDILEGKAEPPAGAPE